jgi:hypothetical protein
MKFSKIGLIAALAAVVLTPVAALAQSAKLDPKMVTKGMAEAPALIPATGMACTLKNALYLGGATDAKTKVKTEGYEVACNEGMGFVILSASGAAKPQVQTCLETARLGPDGKPSNIACKLPENRDQTKALQPFLAKASVDCVSTKARAIGSTADQMFFEVACENGKGYILATGVPATVDKPIQVDPCLAFEAGNQLACTLTDASGQLNTVVDSLAAKSGKNCAVKGRRYILSSKAGDNYYEVSCNDGKGYVLQEASNGSLTNTIDCGQADNIGGGCKMTDSRTAATAQNALYTRLAKAAGFNCDVAKYGALPSTGGIDTVELQCSNRPDGAVGLFGRDAASTKIYNCVESEVAGFRCSFTKLAPLFPKLSADLKTLKPTTTCVVNDARVIGASPDEGFVELSCTDGMAGYVMGINKGDMKPKEALSCGQAKGIGGGCKLQTNVSPTKT